MWSAIFVSMSGETIIFIVVILLFNFYFHLRFTPENSQKAPAFLTTLGILGTFVGIALGLLHFDPDNVQKSVPALIGGIKTAVWASALGIFCALSIKFREILSLNKHATEHSHGATADDIADILKDIDLSLAGEGEESLLGQMKLMRGEQAALKESFDHFKEHNVKLLVAALNDVVRDFNGKISEQFGAHFTQLNNACQEINSLLAQQQIFTANSESFSKTASALSTMMTTLESQRSQIESSLGSLATVLAKASNGLPQIERNVIDMTQQLASANKQFNAHMGEIVAKTKEQVLTLDTALTEELTKSLNSFGRQMASLSQKFADDYGPITERLNRILAIGK